MNNILTTTAQSYINIFGGFQHQFLVWGEGLFFTLLTMNFVWMFLWYAFDNKSLVDGLASFIRRYFVISLFYTLMLNPSWLTELLKSAHTMGQTLSHLPMDPSSLISEGIGIANKIMWPITNSSLLTAGFGLIIASLVYVIVLFVFLNIALELALTLIMTTALITVSSFFLGFAALGATTQIARQTLDVILANCVKLLGIYMVIAVGHNSITQVANMIPETTVSFDAYVWVVAVLALFWLIAKNLPNQLARIVSGAFRENEGVDAAAMAMSVMSYAKTATPAMGVAGGVASGIAKVAGSTAYNAASHFGRANDTKGVLKSAASAVGGSMAHLGKAMGGHVSDHFKNVANKLAGGPGAQQKIRGVSERMHHAAKDVQLNRADRKEQRATPSNSTAGPSSSSTKAESKPSEKKA